MYELEHRMYVFQQRWGHLLLLTWLFCDFNYKFQSDKLNILAQQNENTAQNLLSMPYVSVLMYFFENDLTVGDTVHV